MKPQNAQIWAFILARKNSKRLPGKNRRRIGGISLVQHAMMHAMESEYITSFYLSSDDIILDYQFRQILPRFKAIGRPDHLAGNDADSIDVIRWGLDARSVARSPDYVILLQPTSPLRTPEYVDWCIEQGLENDSDITISGKDRNCGCFYMWSYPYLKSGIDNPESLIVYEDHQCVDIDTIEDLQRARNLYENRAERE